MIVPEYNTYKNLKYFILEVLVYLTVSSDRTEGYGFLGRDFFSKSFQNKQCIAVKKLIILLKFFSYFD